jgi:hypothetical protein
MIDVSELMTDPDFVQPFTVKRFTAGYMVEGEYAQNAPQILHLKGSIQQPNSADKGRFAAEGERNDAIIKVYCAQRLNNTDGEGKQSDVITWQCHEYRVIECRPWVDNGYWLVFAEKI